MFMHISMNMYAKHAPGLQAAAYTGGLYFMFFIRSAHNRLSRSLPLTSFARQGSYMSLSLVVVRASQPVRSGELLTNKTT